MSQNSAVAAPSTAPSAGSYARAREQAGGSFPWGLWLFVGVCAAAFYGLFGVNLRELIAVWKTDPNWGHGFLVPVISAFLVYLNWHHLVRLTPRPAWVGAPMLLLMVAFQIFFRLEGHVHFSYGVMIVAVFAFALLVLGWECLKVLWVPIAYLAFMVPIPPGLYAKLTMPLQYLAAEAGVHLLPLFGIVADRTGTIIEIATGAGVQRMNVEEACSGMRMLMAFFALSVALAYSTERPIWQKLVMATSALPIAILCNALRVTLTGVLLTYAGKDWASGSMHENLGFLMLAPALLLQLLLGWILDHLFIEEPKASASGAGT